MSATTRARPKGGAKRVQHVSIGSKRDEIIGRVIEFLAVWVMAFVVVPSVAEAIHLGWGQTGWRWLVLGVALAAGAGLSWLTYEEAAPRGDFARWRAAITVAAAFVTIGFGTLFGFVDVGLHPWYWRWVDPWTHLYAVFAFVLCVSWNIPRSQAVRGMGDEAPAQPVTTLGEHLGLTKPVKRVGDNVVSDDGIRQEITLQHVGTPQSEMLKRAADIPSSIPGLRPDAVRVVPDPADATRTRVTFVLEDVLRDSPFWPGPSRPGASIAEPCRIGLYEDGTPEEIVRPGDPGRHRNAISLLVMGMPGAGKTEAELHEVSEIVTRHDVVYWQCDTAKGAQTAEDIRPVIDWLVTDKREAKAFGQAIRFVINYRQAALAMLKKNYKAEGRQWTPDAWKHLRMPYLIVDFQEFADVAEMFGADIVRIGEQARSVGVSLSISIQRATADNMSTSLRSSLGAGWAFGIKDSSDANLVLSDVTLSMNANPGVWANYKPGMNYLEASQVEQDRWAMPARTFRPIPAEVLQWHVGWWSQLMAPFDQGSIDSLSPEVRKVYDGRTRCDLSQWLEGHGVDLMHPPKGTPVAAVEAVQNIAAPALAAKTERPVAPPSAATEPEEPTVRSGAPVTEEETEEMIKAEDRDEARAEARASSDPELAGELARVDPRRAAEPVDPADDLPIGDELPDLVGSASEAFVDVLRELLGRHPGSDAVDTDTAELAELLEARGFYGDSNPRPFLIDRLRKLVDLGLAEKLAKGSGPKASRWRVRRDVLRPPVPDTDGE